MTKYKITIELNIPGDTIDDVQHHLEDIDLGKLDEAVKEKILESYEEIDCEEIRSW